MHLCGVLGARRVAEASEVLTKVFSDPDYTVFLALAGPVVAGGLRNIVSELVNKRLVNVIVSNGANLTHDLIESLGFRHIRGDFHPNDATLSLKGIGRVGDIYVDQKAFQVLEKEVHKMLDKIREKEPKKNFALFEILEKFGLMLKDKNSILASTSKAGIPIICPGIYDSMLGVHLWTYSKLKGMKLDFSLDMDKMAEIIFKSKKVGAVILGGGIPKHFVLGASMFRGGVDAAVQITMDRPETGSLSGAPLEEAISWRKAKVKSTLVTVIGDFTVLFPLIVTSALANLRQKS